MSKRTVLVLAALLVLAVGAAPAQNPWIGTWKANLAESVFASNPPPRSIEYTWSQEPDGRLKFAAKRVPATGETIQYTYICRCDGDEVPMPGWPDAGRTIMAIISTDLKSSIWLTKRDGKIAYMGLTAISADGKTLIQTSRGMDQKGRLGNTRIVFERQ
ncbi:MAG: hypothetical protein KatS3mg005_2333 [Bryobacteraceae bacterium]|nr:MAG: hypothetical protein KatS3mg005_2333 [Bryobacteraceae bacterium]